MVRRVATVAFLFEFSVSLERISQSKEQVRKGGLPPLSQSLHSNQNREPVLATTPDEAGSSQRNSVRTNTSHP